jgi:hypothetical protein
MKRLWSWTVLTAEQLNVFCVKELYG